jgi:peptidoglycan/xylan/chitin deacetylase (PgdA/CDA1 family)
MNTPNSALPELPASFTGLAPFRAAFVTGVPMLMYHNLRARPARARTKTIYLRPRDFTRHLAELSEAGFRSQSLDEKFPTEGNPQRRVILSFDDGYASVLQNGLKPLESFGFRAIQFLVAGLIGGRNEWDIPLGEVPAPLLDDAQVRDWLAAGHQIGAHTVTHPDLTNLPEAHAREEITAAKKRLEDRFGVPIHHFCYPYGRHNERVRDMVAAAGYRTACTTTPGLNTAATDPLALPRLSTRDRPRRWQNLWGLR